MASDSSGGKHTAVSLRARKGIGPKIAIATAYDATMARLLDAGGVDALMVGDSIVDWRTARAAGTCVCLARYGFGFEGFPVGELAPDERVIDSPAALLTLL